MRKTTTLFTTIGVALVLAVAAPASYAKKGGKPGRGGGGGGGGGTPADPEIAYIDYNQSDSLRVMDADGANQTTLVSDIRSAGLTCSWSPDRSRIYFEGNVSGLGLYVYDFATKSVKQVFSGDAFYVTCSPELDASGNYLVAFTGPPASGASRPDVWVYDPATDSSQNLTAGLLGSSYGRGESYPAWSPDGDRIAWRWREREQRLVDGQNRLVTTAAGLEVYSFSLDGATGKVTLGTRDAVVTAVEDPNDPSFDPNEIGFLWLDWSRSAGSDTLVYADYIESDLQYDLFKIDISTGDVTRLTTTSNVDERNPGWSSDDALIAFSRKGTGSEKKRSGLYTMTPSGGSLTSLGAKTGSGPDWVR